MCASLSKSNGQICLSYKTVRKLYVGMCSQNMYKKSPFNHMDSGKDIQVVDISWKTSSILTTVFYSNKTYFKIYVNIEAVKAFTATTGSSTTIISVTFFINFNKCFLAMYKLFTTLNVDGHFTKVLTLYGNLLHFLEQKESTMLLKENMGFTIHKHDITTTVAVMITKPFILTN